MNTELYAFVKEALDKKLDRASIRDVLVQAGWNIKEVEKVLSAFAEVDFAIPVPRPKPYLQAREAFLYLISFITLYITAFSFGALVFGFIDKFFPDPLSYAPALRSLNTALASIIIAFPVYLFVTWRLSLATLKNPERKDSKVRKWLTYLTLVVAAAVIIGDLIAIVSGLLGGDITIRFLLRAVTIFAITASIFGYYLLDLQKEEKEE
ncbi:MAG: DUF5671 domain-containing protein [Patescibacteria group bacterium]|nr:DUF5671 domain-containing protein [Patescibacteria group bacterium]